MLCIQDRAGAGTRAPGGRDAGSLWPAQRRAGAGRAAGGGRVLPQLDIAGIADRAAPVREMARATHGQVIEALIANRLTSPAPMIHVEAWARQFAVEHVRAWTRTCSTTTGSPGRWTHWPRCWSR